MKTNAELKAALHMVLARLESDPKSAFEWEVIRRHLYGAARYAANRSSQGVAVRIHAFYLSPSAPTARMFARWPQCGSKGMVQMVSDESLVTCKRCLRQLEKDAAFARAREVSRRRAGRKP